ncbi:MAG: hypothetical protein OXQ89_21875, partial [Rhodospirillaceae bacterium]|nr:hypothetical protein [Rhodospirillaceae bacterium]
MPDFGAEQPSDGLAEPNRYWEESDPPPAPSGDGGIAAAVAALAPNTRRAYGSAWAAWQRWA